MFTSVLIKLGFAEEIIEWRHQGAENFCGYITYDEVNTDKEGLLTCIDLYCDNVNNNKADESGTNNHIWVHEFSYEACKKNNLL